MPARLVKRPDEVRTYSLDFANLLETGETVATILAVTESVPPGGSPLAIGPAVVGGTKIQFTIGGGSDGFTYHLTGKITTSGGHTLEDCGLLKIEAC